jgi:ProQ/FINO family
MPPRKVVNGSSPLVIIRKKKTHQPTPGAAAKNGTAATPATPVPRPASTPAATPSPHLTPPPARSASPPIQPQPVAPQPETMPTQPNRRQRKAQAPHQLLAVLRTRWPAAFPEDPRKIRPLMRGVHHEIAKLLPGTALWLIKRAIILFQRLSGSAYWWAVLKGGPRYALDGSPCGEVIPREQEHAKQTLALAQQREASRQAAFSESGTPPPPPDRGHAV